MTKYEKKFGKYDVEILPHFLVMQMVLCYQEGPVVPRQETIIS